MTNLKITKEKRIGEMCYNTYGSKMEIISYRGCGDLTVRFEDGYTVKSSYKEYIKGLIKNPNNISVCGVGFMGEGKYASRVNHLKTKMYNTWRGMIQRCYDEEHRYKTPTYKDCTVCEEWHNFQNFGKWYEDNYYEVDGQRISLDKDILIKGNKIYSPETCVFAPQRINILFVKRDADRGLWPIGVHLSTSKKKYEGSCKNLFNKNVSLGSYTNPTDAFFSYKTYKENLIQTMADMYKLLIPTNLYSAMMNYQVEITD